MPKSKIRIGRASAPVSIAEAIENSGYEFSRTEDGQTVIGVNFPGCKTVELTHSGLLDVAATLTLDVPQGDSPEAVFARSAQDSADGSMTARFSDEKRSRSVTFTAQDRDDVAGLLVGLAAQWEAFEAQLAEMEAEAAKPDGEGN